MVMTRVRTLRNRIREERRVRRDFDRLMQEEGFGPFDNSLRGERPPKREKKKRPRWQRWFLRGGTAFVALFSLLLGAILFAPLPETPPALYQTAFVYDRAGRLIGEIRPQENRVVVPLRRIPQNVKDAVIAAEDERFYSHPGVDLGAILRAAWADLTGGTFQGGSTITQQLVRNSYPDVGRERTIWRKIREAVVALRYDREFSKDDILDRYLNTVYFGHGAYGVEAAAESFFGKHIWEVELSEAATLAGIIQAPTRFSPRLHREDARARRNHILQRMAGLGLIRETDARRAGLEPLVVEPERLPRTRAPHFIVHVRRRIAAAYGDQVLYRAGLRIETTLDLRIQRAAQRAVREVLDQPGDPEAAVVSVDVRTGGILAMVGGRSFRQSQVNLATGQGGSGRQAGSAFKVFVLARALREGMSPYKVYSAPSRVTIGDWSPSNYGGGSYGALTIRSATIRSVNTVFAQLIEDVGPTDVAEMARAMGIRSYLPENDASIALGTAEVNPLEMASAFATLSSGGVYREPTPVARLVDAGGEVLEELDPDGERVLPKNVALQETSILREVVRYGTGTRARLEDAQVAGKTGTTDDNSDAWFCGYTTRIATCVWVGYRDGRTPMNDVHGIAVTGGSFPAEIWRTFMEQVPDLGGEFESPTAGPYVGSSTPSPSPEPTDGEPSTGPSPPPSPSPSPSPTPTSSGVIPSIFPSPTPPPPPE